MGQHFPQSWLWQVLERSQRSWGLPKWCYLKAQLFLQLLGVWGALVVACTELGFASVQICLSQRRSHPAWGGLGVSPVVGGSRSDTWISTAAVAVSLVTELLASTWVRKGTCSSWVPLYPTPLVPLSPLHLYMDGSRFLHSHIGQYDVLIHHEF